MLFAKSPIFAVHIMAAFYISLKQLLTHIQNKFRENFSSSYWIKAEVAGVRKVGSHIYFDLIELERGAKVAQIRACAFFGEGTTAIAAFEKETGQKFSEGIKIGARVSVNYHPVYGLSLVLSEIDSQLTLGGIELQRKETLKKLHTNHPQIIRFIDGSFVTPNKLLPLPRAIQRIALVTSASSDAYADFTHCLKTNESGYQFTVDLYNVLVQGYGAQSSLYDAFSKIRLSGNIYDVVVLTRGGGAPADFLPYDDYHLSLMLAQFPTPVITGIGHHMNQGICDFFARVHTKTPSTAAQFIIDHNYDFEKKIKELSDTIQSRSVDRLRTAGQKFNNLQTSFRLGVKNLLRDHSEDLRGKRFLINTRARQVLNTFEKDLNERTLKLSWISNQQVKSQQQQLATLSTQICQGAPNLVQQKQRSLQQIKELIEQANPEKILKRGFAILKKDGLIVNEPATLKAGDKLEIIQHQSIIKTEVIETEKYNGREFEL